MQLLTAVIQDLINNRPSIPVATPPRIQRTDSDSPPLSDTDDLLEQEQKRSPDRSPSKQTESSGYEIVSNNREHEHIR
jgi:hypothetical protein